MRLSKKQNIIFLIILVLLLSVISLVIHLTTIEEEDTHELEQNHEEKEHKIDEKKVDSSDDEKEVEEEDEPYIARNPLPSLGEYKPTTIEPGAKGTYEITYQLNTDEIFTVHTTVEVVNSSQDNWEQIAFYVIPNALTEISEQEFEMGEVTVNEEVASFQLQDNQLFVQLTQPLKPEDSTTITIDYNMKVAPDGIRLRKFHDSYHLVYSYPMLATYQDGWNIESFNPLGESYHTDYSDFTVHYELPEDYYVVSSAVDGSLEAHRSGTIQGNTIKDFYIGFLHTKEWTADTLIVNGTTIRAFAREYKEESLSDNMSYIKDAFTFFSNTFGSYIKEELDVVMNNGGMEYPSVIEVNEPATLRINEYIIAHEIAHQWFYYMVSNDPYKDAWVDEGLTEFATSLYLNHQYNEREAIQTAQSMALFRPGERKVNQTLDDYDERYYGADAYGIPTIQLWDFFQDNGEISDAHDFLSSYVETYKFKQVTTEEFVRFFEVYHQQHEHHFFNQWLDINWDTLY